MITLPLGIAFVLSAIYFSISPGDLVLYLNLHAALIVLGGTFGVLFFATPKKTIANILGSIRDLARPQRSSFEEMPVLEDLSRDKLASVISTSELINYAGLLWQSGVTREMVVVLLSQKKFELENKRVDALQALRNLAKYPPAFGMTGTVIALVSLFTKLGVSDRVGLGQALALAMTATFFGLVLANGCITPLADRLHIYFLSHRQYLDDVYQVLLLINRDEAIELKNDVSSQKKTA